LDGVANFNTFFYKCFFHYSNPELLAFLLNFYISVGAGIHSLKHFAFVTCTGRNFHRLKASMRVTARSCTRHLRSASLLSSRFRSFFFLLAPCSSECKYSKNDNNFLHVYPPFVGWLLVNGKIITLSFQITIKKMQKIV